MLFRSILVAGLAGLVAADYASILASLQTIDKDTLKLNSDVSKYDGNILLALPILGSSVQLNNDLGKGKATADKSAMLTVNEAVQLVTPVQKLAGDVNTTLTNLISKYPTFKKSSLTGVVLLVLKTSKGAASDYSNAVIKKVPTELQSIAQSVVDPINDAFAKAIAVYQK